MKYMQMDETYLQDLLVRMAFHNAGLEGNRLLYEDVYAILTDQYMAKPTNEREYYEIVNHKEAFRVLMAIRGEKMVTLDHVFQLHKALMKDISVDAGRFRKGDVYIMGADFVPPKSYEVEEKIRSWIANTAYRLRLGCNMCPETIILEQHRAFEKIHPFSDGNGRTGRMIMLAQCLQVGIDPFVIKKEDKEIYLRFLRSGKVEELLETICPHN